MPTEPNSVLHWSTGNSTVNFSSEFICSYDAELCTQNMIRYTVERAFITLAISISVSFRLRAAHRAAAAAALSSPSSSRHQFKQSLAFKYVCNWIGAWVQRQKLHHAWAVKVNEMVLCCLCVCVSALLYSRAFVIYSKYKLRIYERKAIEMARNSHAAARDCQREENIYTENTRQLFAFAIFCFRVRSFAVRSRVMRIIASGCAVCIFRRKWHLFSHHFFGECVSFFARSFNLITASAFVRHANAHVRSLSSRYFNFPGEWNEASRHSVYHYYPQKSMQSISMPLNAERWMPLEGEKMGFKSFHITMANRL